MRGPTPVKHRSQPPRKGTRVPFHANTGLCFAKEQISNRLIGRAILESSPFRATAFVLFTKP